MTKLPLDVNVTIGLDDALGLLLKSAAAVLMHKFGPARELPAAPETEMPSSAQEFGSAEETKKATAAAVSEGDPPPGKAVPPEDSAAPPPPAALDAAPTPPKRVRKWSPERTALLVQQYPGGALIEDILAQVNSLPGPKLCGTYSIKDQVKVLGLHRETRARNPTAVPAAQPKPAAIPAAPRFQAMPPAQAIFTRVATVTAKPPEPQRVIPPAEVKARISGRKVRVSIGEAEAWAAQRGMCNGVGAQLDLDAVNAFRAKIGMPLFELIGAGR